MVAFCADVDHVEIRDARGIHVCGIRGLTLDMARRLADDLLGGSVLRAAAIAVFNLPDRQARLC